MAYMLLLAVILFVLRTHFVLSTMKTHDRTLFRFCDLRRDMIAHLYNKRDELTPEDYAQFRIVLNSLNNTIHFYNDFKIHFFNLRKLLKSLVWRVQSSTTQIDAVRISRNKELLGFVKKYEKATLLGFFAYTPFLGTEVTVRLVIQLLKLIAQTTKKKGAATYAEWLEKLNARRTTTAFG